MIWPFIIPWFITSCLYWYEVIKQDKFTTYSRYTLILQASLVMTFLIYIWYKTPKFDDLWRIRKELILTIRILVIGLAIFFVLGIMLDWQPPGWKYAVLSSVATIAAFLQCYCILCYPLKRFDLPSFIWSALIYSKSDLLKQKMELSLSV